MYEYTNIYLIISLNYLISDLLMELWHNMFHRAYLNVVAYCIQ